MNGFTKLLLAGSAAALVLAGCGASSTVEDPVVSSPAEVEIIADGKTDREIGEDLRKYLVRNCPDPGQPLELSEKVGPRMREFFEKGYESGKLFCGSLESIGVDNGTLTLHSSLNAADGEAAAFAFCNLVQGSDVADFTPGHRLLGSSGELIEVCGTHNAYR